MRKIRRLFIMSLMTILPASILFQNCSNSFKPVSSFSSLDQSSLIATGNHQVQLTWTPPTTNLPSAYVIQQSTDNVNFKTVQQVPVGVTTANVSGLGSMVFYFRVLSSNATAQSASPVIVADLTNIH